MALTEVALARHHRGVGTDRGGSMKALQIWVAVMILGICGVSAAAAEEGLAVAGRLPIDVHSELMVATGDSDYALNWFNCGSLWNLRRFWF
jgi:hypothetical protein